MRTNIPTKIGPAHPVNQRVAGIFSLSEKLELLTDQVGQFTEGLPELRRMVREQLDVTKSQEKILIFSLGSSIAWSPKSHL